MLATMPFEKARKENKPIFSLIGYFTCHCAMLWRGTRIPILALLAAILHQYFSFHPSKSNSGRRPDIDPCIIAYVEARRKRGWPLNVLLTPTQNPFSAAPTSPRTT